MDSEDFPSTSVTPEAIAPEQLKERIDAGETVTLVDVRSEADYEEWHIDGESVDSVNVPHEAFQGEAVDSAVLETIPDDREVVVLCAQGKASEFVAGRLLERDYDAVQLADGMDGWASIYEANEVTAYDGAGTLLQYQRPSSGCLSYLLYDDGEAAVIDPLRAFTDRYLEDAAALDVDLVYAIDTHVHADHVSGVRTLDAAGADGVLPDAAVGRGVTYADDLETVADGDTVRVGDVPIEAVYTPGHTTGMTSYLVDDRFLATGDGLFVESVARPDLEEGDDGAPEAARMLHDTIQNRILALPDETVIGGGHASDGASAADDGTYTARLGTLVEEMPALTMNANEFVETVLADMPPRPANYEDIIATNLGQNAVDDDEAFSLELGPNNCAASQTSLAGE